MIQRLIKGQITAATHPEVHASFDKAWDAIRDLDAQRWLKPASDSSIGHALSFGAQLGWIPRDYAGCPQVFKSMQIDLCGKLDAMDVLEHGPAKRIAQEALIAELRRHLTRQVLGADQRQRGRVDAVRPAAPTAAREDALM
jgi:hypothetical protein